MRAVLLAVLSIATSAVPQFDVNLDAPPEQRWRDVTNYYREDILAMSAHLGSLFNVSLSSQEKSDWVNAMEATMEDEHKAELQGIVDDMNSDAVTLQNLILFNALYELGSPTMCSGVLAATSYGRMIHGRNMDYTFKYELPDGSKRDWPDITFDATWWKKGQKLMTSVQWPMFIGLHTAMRFDGWTFEQNTRQTNDAGENLKVIKQGGKLFGLVLRNVMESVSSFDDAVSKLSAQNFAAPQYFILAGAGDYEGAVITIDRGGHRLPDTPPVQRINKESGTWHLIQTNDDLNKPALDPRRPILEMLLEHRDQSEVSEDFMWQTVRGAPLYLGVTAFSWVASPKTGYHLTLVHSEPVPKAGSVTLATEPGLHAAQSLKRKKLLKTQNLKELHSR